MERNEYNGDILDSAGLMRGKGQDEKKVGSVRLGTHHPVTRELYTQ